MYAASVTLPGLDVCPFCRETFPPGEHQECPHCGVHLEAAATPPAQVDALDEDDQDDGEPLLPWTHWGNARGPLVLVALLGLAVFFAPWVHAYVPDRAVYSGLDIARRTGMAWAAAVAWFTLLPVVLSRRSLQTMRGARVAAALLSLLPGVVALLLLLHPPGNLEAHGISVRIRFAWGWGIYATLALSMLSTPFAFLRLGR